MPPSSFLFLAVQVSFLLFLPCLLLTIAWLGTKAINVLGDHLERLQAKFDVLVTLEEKQRQMLQAVLNKLL